MGSVPALPGHALYLLLLQIALILTVSRLLAELAKRIGQPAVLGELLAGIVLGPSLFGAVWPHGFEAVFPAEVQQAHLLEVVAWIGMVLLLLLTGLETDIRLLKRLGRSALAASGLGMVVPFVSGFALGMVMPAEFLGIGQRRVLFAAFLATGMSISAMPVIAKILMDLGLTKRNIGVVILSAGVVDDTTGWLILSLIAGIAGASSSGARLAFDFVKTLALTGGFLAFCAFIVHPLARRLFHLIDEKARTPQADLPAIVGLAFVLAAITEHIGVHAVFGAFIAGCILRQVPTLREATLHKLESVSLSIFAPIFFGMVGLKVDLRTLSSPRWFLVVLGVATFGKMVGCTWGALVGRLSMWEATAVGIAMNARGAMELVVALIGLNLGIISPPMFAIIVMMAIVTSFMAPIGLRLVMLKLRMTAEEEARILQASRRGLFAPDRLKVTLATAGGPNALGAGRMAVSLVQGDTSLLTLLYVESNETAMLRRWWRRLRPDPAGRNLSEHLELIKAWAVERAARVEVRRSSEADPGAYILKEASRGADLLVVGAGARTLRSSMTSALVGRAPCHVAVLRARGPARDPEHLLVAVDGSYFSRAAMELAVRYAERVHATVTVLYWMESEPDKESTGSAFEDNFRRMMATTVLTTLSPLIGQTTAQVNVIVSETAQQTPPVLAEARSGRYQLVVVGAEDGAFVHRLSVGYDVERIVADAPCSVLVVVPRIHGQAEAHN